MLVVTPCRSGTGMEFIMEQNGWNIPSSGSDQSVERRRRITRRIKAYLLQKLIDDTEQCSIEIYVCLFALMGPSYLLTCSLCWYVYKNLRYMFSPLPMQRLVSLGSKSVLQTIWLVLLFNVCCCVFKMNPYFCNRTLNCYVVHMIRYPTNISYAVSIIA